MNKRIDLTNLGGFPLEQDTLKFMQDSYAAAFGAVAGYFGDKVIVSGVQVSGGSVSDGWITYLGELVPFIGGALGADVVISEVTGSVTFEDGVSREVYFTKTATCGVSGSFPFADLKTAGIVPRGLISMWSGAVGAIPTGWALCDGTNGTPDLKGRFIAGYDPGDVDYDTIGKTGGEKKHTLTKAELPSYNVTVPLKSVGGITNDSTGGGYGYGAEKTDRNILLAAGGSGLPHENRAPYYTLAYIIKL